MQEEAYLDLRLGPKAGARCVLAKSKIVSVYDLTAKPAIYLRAPSVHIPRFGLVVISYSTIGRIVVYRSIPLSAYCERTPTARPTYAFSHVGAFPYTIEVYENGFPTVMRDQYLALLEQQAHVYSLTHTKPPQAPRCKELIYTFGKLLESSPLMNIPEAPRVYDWSPVSDDEMMANTDGYASIP